MADVKAVRAAVRAFIARCNAEGDRAPVPELRRDGFLHLRWLLGRRGRPLSEALAIMMTYWREVPHGH